MERTRAREEEVMKILGFTVTRTENIKDVIKTLDALENHIFRYTLFMDSSGKTKEDDRNSGEITDRILTSDKAFSDMRNRMEIL